MSGAEPRAPLRAVLLDVDGTLIDSNDAHAQSWVETLHDFGRDVPLTQVRRLIGKGGDRIVREVAGLEPDSSLAEDIQERRKRLFCVKYLPQLRPLPGVRELLERLRADGLRLVAATSAGADEMAGLLEVAGARDLIDEATSASEVEHSKPAPDVVTAALRKARCSTDEALMLGDTPYDVEAASRAGVPIIAFRSGGWSDSSLAGAIAIYNGPDDLLEHYTASPLAWASREHHPVDQGAG